MITCDSYGLCFFFFKQKTAYEMRISDWSSDVCSSDLFATLEPPLGGSGAVIIGNGNVALDVARILSKTEDEFVGSDIVAHALEHLKGSAVRRITILGRRGPHQIAMTPKELGELEIGRAHV